MVRVIRSAPGLKRTCLRTRRAASAASSNSSPGEISARQSPSADPRLGLDLLDISIPEHVCGPITVEVVTPSRREYCRLVADYAADICTLSACRCRLKTGELTVSSSFARPII